MESETTDEECARQLQEPLLVLEPGPAPPPKGTRQRREANTDPRDAEIEPMDVEEEPPGEDERNRVSRWFRLWILFQCVLPALVLAFEGDVVDAEDAVIVSAVSSVAFYLYMALGLHVVARDHNSRDFCWKLALPTASWMVLLFFDEEDGVFFSAVAILLLAIVFCKRGRGVDYIVNWCIVRPSDRIKSLEDDFFEQLREDEAAEQEQLETQVERLSYLEELAVAHPRKKPICMIGTLVATGILTLAFIVYIAGLLSDGAKFLDRVENK
mmetsp:Transcript_34542/g.75607  ORF Transcript_34542/g.75607 Transcript_34542/m.75607 type:complete len:269 (+) Transcript_34542:151-957(+)